MGNAGEVVVLNASGHAADTVEAHPEFSCVAFSSPSDALARVAELRARSVTTALVVAPEQVNVPALVLEAGRRTPEVPIILAAEPRQGSLSARVVSRPARSPALSAAIVAALRAAGQQARVRTTLDRLNVRLQTGAPPDAAQYRRLTLSGLYLAAILEQARDAIFVTDRDGLVAMWNRAAGELFGVGAPDVLGRRIDTVIGGDAGTSLLDGIRACSPAAPSLSRELIVRGKGERHVELSLSLVMDERQEGVAVSVVARDVTGDRQLQRELQERAHALAESNRHKDEFLAVLSHELRTPLNAVLGWAQILVKTGVSNEGAGRAVEMITRNAELQRHLVEDLLDYARIAAGRLPMTMVEAEVSEIVRLAVDTFRLAIDERQLRLVETYAVVAPTQLDPHRFRQVISNLIANAVKFTDPGGELFIAVEATPDGVEVVVRDTGRGIAPEFLPFVFDEFRQADASPTRSEPGLGLGLAIARRIVQLHGGDISASSAGVGRGAQFVVRIPARAAAGPSPR